MKDLYISDLLSPDSRGGYISLIAAVQSREVKQGSRGPWMTLTLIDRTGSIDAVWFSPDGGESQIRPDMVVEAEGIVGEYNKKPQINISNCSPYTEAYDRAEFQPTTKFSISSLWNSLNEIIGRIQNRDISRLVETIIHDPEIKRRLEEAPAGMRVHHCFIGGLLEHTVSMCRAAWMITRAYPRLNADVLIAGCILHDLAKVYELTWDLSFGYSKVGSLIGHIPMVYALIDRTAERIGTPEETKILIEHLVLSHHGTLEHGAAKVPATAEAIALSAIDGLDANLEQFWRLTDAAPAGDEFTSWVSSRGTHYYVGTKPEAVREGQAA